MQNTKKQNRLSVKPSKELIDLLERDRIIPPNVRLFGTWEMLETIWKRVREETINNPVYQIVKNAGRENHAVLNKKVDREALKRTWEATFEYSKEGGYDDLVKYILDKFPPEKGYEFFDWIFAFNEFVIARHTLVTIVRSAKDLSNFGKMSEFEYFSSRTRELSNRLAFRDPRTNYVPLLTHVGVSLSADGTIDFLNDPVVKALHKAPIDRLRFCPICDHIFWAYRLNQRWCSKKCADIHFQKQRRSDPKVREEINEKRRRNYAHKTANQKLKGKK
ncbi:MAG TPA: hypothetical protein VIL74_03700 [Pyrinomonadaceae bacterium]|jgi:predicted nucleic acid-binding Zn ribbon protein